MAPEGSNREEPWWFSPLPGQLHSRGLTLAGGLFFAFGAVLQWWDVARQGWWPQVLGGVAFTGLAGLFLATAVSLDRAKKRN
jgi:hypothetical protein